MTPILRQIEQKIKKKRKNKENRKNKKFIMTVALVIVMVTTIVGSTFLKSFMNWIGMKDSLDLENESQ